MPRGKQSKGICLYCQQAFTKNSATKHLAMCPKRQAVIEQADRKQGTAETLYHLRVQDAWNKEFWLDLEMRSAGTLEDFDSYLRSIWLECCGHMSQFSFGG